MTLMTADDALDLYKTGAGYIILPNFLGGERVSLLFEESRKDIKKLLISKIEHIKELKHRKLLGHVHPVMKMHR